MDAGGAVSDLDVSLTRPGIYKLSFPPSGSGNPVFKALLLYIIFTKCQADFVFITSFNFFIYSSQPYYLFIVAGQGEGKMRLAILDLNPEKIDKSTARANGKEW